ncbi:hypothetical protein PanWU01x14_318480 [Parasponia andersonii]|uniref:Uncharacterized protein n=1 Tax=Parasponia andersonii TaxID=3476 RepID=A0A2P5AME8_PARAD|nr:hypothetical protein PanWU01x14_318480 [Parasponia andersonii]
MLQWMGGSRRKVTASRKSTHKRQKQYFEQRKQQQQYQLQTEMLENYADGMDISGQQYHKEHRSLDVLSLLNLSASAQEQKSSFPRVSRDLDVNASTRENEVRNSSPVIHSETVVPANFVQIKEARIPHGFQVETACLKKISPSAPDSHNSVLSGINSKPEQQKTTNEQQLSVLDLLGDDGLNGNMEGTPVHEAHVAFSVEGLGKVGMETPVHSPQEPNRNFSCGISSPLKAAGWQKLSKNFNSLLDDLEFEGVRAFGDPMVEDIDVPLSIDCLDFSSGIMDSLCTPKDNSFTVPDRWQQDSYSSKRNSSFIHPSEDKWNGRPSFPYCGFFEEREHDMSRKTWQSGIDDNSADNLIYGNSNYDMSDFSFKGPHQAIRPPTVERNFDLKPVTSQPDRFCFGTEDAQDNSSLQSEESCSSSAVRFQATDKSLPNSTSWQGRRGPGNAFAGSGDQCGLKKAFANETKDDRQKESMACVSGKRKNMLNLPKSKASHLSSPFFQENLGTEDIWFFEEAYATVDMYPGSSSFDQNSGTKYTGFDTEPWDKDPLSKFPAPKLHVAATPSCDRFNCEPVESSPSNCFNPKIPFHASSIISMPDFYPDSESRRMHQDSSYIAGSQGETPSPDLSVQESFSKDVEYKPKFERSNCGTSELEKEIYSRKEVLVCEDKEAKDGSNLEDNDHEGTNEGLADPMEKTSPAVHTTDRSGNPKDEKDRQKESMACVSGKRKNMLNLPKSKASLLSSPFFQENLGTEDIWFFEEAYATVDMYPGSSSFDQNSGTKYTGFDTEPWDKDPLSKFPAPKLHVAATPSCDRFNCEPVESSPSNCFNPKIPFHASSIISMPDFYPDSESRRMPQDSSYIAGSQGEMPSPDLSVQESFSKDVEYKLKFERSNCGTSELEKEIYSRKEVLACEDKEAKDGSNLEDNDHEGMNEGLADPMEKTSPAVHTTDRSGNPKDEKEDHLADKVPLKYKNVKEDIEDFAPVGRFGSKQKSAYVDSSCQAMMLQSYVFQFFCVQKRLK